MNTLQSASPKRMLFQWITEHTDNAGLTRMLNCIKEYQKHFKISSGVKLDSSIRSSAFALDQLFRFESQGKALFDILLGSLFEIYRKDFEEYLKEAKDALSGTKSDVEVVRFMREFQKKLVKREYAWMAYVWSEGVINWEDECDFVKWFMFCTHQVPNIFRSNVVLSGEQISAVYVRAIKPSEIEPVTEGKKDWLTEMFRKPGQTAAKTRTPKAKTAKKTAAKKSSVKSEAAAVAPAEVKPASTAADTAPVKTDPEARTNDVKPEEQTETPVPAEAPARPGPSAKPTAAPYQPKPVASVFDVRNRMNAISMPSPGFTRYFGYVRRFAGFLNFYVVGEFISGGYLQDAGPELYTKMFPAHGGITLRTARRPNIPDGAFMTIDLQASDLDDNIDWTTKQKRTDFAKYADFDVLERANRIRPAAESLCFIVVYPDLDRQPIPDFEKNIPVTNSLYGDEAMLDPRLINLPVLLAHEGYFYGPAALREDTQKNLYINLQTSATAGLVHAWSSAGSRTVHVNVFSGVDDTGVIRKSVDVICCRSLKEVVRDVASDATLLKKLSSVVSSDRTVRDRVSEWVDRNADAPSLFTEDDRVRDARCARIENMLARDARNDSFLTTAARLMSSAFEIDGADDPMVTRLVEQVANDPKLMKKLESHKVITAKLDVLREGCERMQSELDDLTKRHQEEEARFKASVEEKNRKLLDENDKLSRSLEEKQKKLGTLDACADDIEMRNRLAAEMKELEARKNELTSQVEGIGDLLKKSVRDCRSVAFNGALASKFREAAAQWESGVETERFAERFEAVKRMKPARIEGKNLADYLVKAVRTERDFTRNEILNLAVCATQSFLTIFAGPPGCGKTSICHLLGRVLGLSDMSGRIPEGFTGDASELSRFVPVAVGRGWTSRRDFLGYWNPLSKTFESSDPRRWEALRELDAEKRAGWAGLPFFMLLDEANLSAPEHYWGDFMALADDRGSSASISFGDRMLYGIPDTLRFLATVNHDHTVESLSPRLIDRSMIVTLPELTCDGLMNEAKPESDFEPLLIPWEAMKETFGARPIKSRRSEIEDLLVGLYERFAQAGMPLSPRTRRAAEGYVSAASAVFESGDRPAHIEAVDFAVSQKLLPRISGSGEEFRKHLVGIRDALENSALERSLAMMEGILRRGDEAMGYWRYF